MRSYVTRHSTAHPEETARHNMDRHQKEVRNRPKIHLIEVRIWAVSQLLCTLLEQKGTNSALSKNSSFTPCAGVFNS